MTGGQGMSLRPRPRRRLRRRQLHFDVFQRYDWRTDPEGQLVPEVLGFAVASLLTVSPVASVRKEKCCH